MTDAFFMYDMMVASQRHTNTRFVYYYDHNCEQSFIELPGNVSTDLGKTYIDFFVEFSIRTSNHYFEK